MCTSGVVSPQRGVSAWRSSSPAGDGRGRRFGPVHLSLVSATVVTSPAKLTVSLRVTGVLANGYHTIDAEMVSLDLADTLLFDKGDSLQVIVEGAATHGLAVTVGADNLVSRALAMVDRRAMVTIQKRIPAGAGLGGGSGNAAAVLRWAGRVGADDVAASARLGADVPFCVVGGRARVLGIGEQIEPLPFVDRVYTLICPPFGVSTPAVYRAWDELGGPTGDGTNDLEPAALLVEPRLAEWRDRLGDATGVRPQLAGSGSTWFVDGAFPGDGRIVARTLPAFT
jgi:4-diphosphocytidyl-2-C-methyl-D-erythritol kinase